jgi:hypothetical protein
MRLTLFRCDFGGLPCEVYGLPLRGHADSTPHAPPPQDFFTTPLRPDSSIPPRASLLTPRVSFISMPVSFLSPPVCLLSSPVYLLSHVVSLNTFPAFLLLACVFLLAAHVSFISTCVCLLVEPVSFMSGRVSFIAAPTTSPAFFTAHAPLHPTSPTTLSLRLPAPLCKCRAYPFGNRRLNLLVNLKRRFNMSDSLCVVTEFVVRQASVEKRIPLAEVITYLAGD